MIKETNFWDIWNSLKDFSYKYFNIIKDDNLFILFIKVNIALYFLFWVKIIFL